MRDPKEINVEYGVGVIYLSGDTYPINRQIRSHNGVWEPSQRRWVIIRTAASEEWAASVATGSSTSDAPTAPTVIDIEPPARRRVSRAATGDAEKNPDVQLGDMTPAERVMRSMQDFLDDERSKPAPVAQAPGLTEIEVKALIADAVKVALESVRATRLDITSNSEVIRTVEGLQHKQLPTLIRCLQAGLNVWVTGPTQASKTHSAEQAAKALGLDYYFQGSMSMAHELLGFVDAAGHYHDTQFVRCFRDGGLILLDEVDAGTNEALLGINAALSNGHTSLPNGELLKRHPEFRCMVAANTWGSATHEYSGRTRIDAAFIARFGAKINWTYDEELETALAGNAEWTARVQRARKRAKEEGLKVVISPRASYSGAALIAAGFTSDEAAELTYWAGLTDDQKRSLG